MKTKKNYEKPQYNVIELKRPDLLVGSGSNEEEESN